MEDETRLWRDLASRLAKATAESATAVMESMRPAFERAGLGEQFRAYETEVRLLNTDLAGRLKGRAEQAADAAGEFARATAGFARAGGEALRLFWEKGRAVRLDPSKPDETLRALHEAWLSSYNEAMRAYFLGDEFGRALGRFLETRTEAEQKVRAEGEKLLKGIGGPTRTEVDSLHKRILEAERRLDRVDPPVKRGGAGKVSQRGRRK